jgi:REP element-mobilizing transposase RayT
VYVENGWYHVTSRGIERRAIFENDSEHAHFLELLGEMAEQFRVIIHAHVELDNHYHLILQTPEANLSQVVQWLNISYAVWVNRRRDRVGPLMQGRFKSIPIENSTWAYELSLYVHLNPVMRKAHGLGKREKAAESLGMTVPDPETVTKRLAEVRQYPWSSYRAYAGYSEPPEWLRTQDILQRAARNKSQRVKRYRADMQHRLSKGVEPLLRERLADGFALGTEAFRERIRQAGKGGREIVGSGRLRKWVSFEDLVAIIERLRDEDFKTFMARRGDWAKPLLLWALRRYSGMTLREVGGAVGGMDYTAVAMAIKRLEKRAAKDAGIRQWMQAVKQECEK